jgi:hypothetical protein
VAQVDVAIIQIVLAIVSLIGPQAAAPGQRLNPSIGQPNPRLYGDVVDARNWKNPILTIQDDGVNVSMGGRSVPRHVPTDRLGQFLVELPVSAWPYGRVVAQSDQGIVPVGSDDYLRRMAATRARVAEILKRLDIMAELWPSA